MARLVSGIPNLGSMRSASRRGRTEEGGFQERKRSWYTRPDIPDIQDCNRGEAGPWVSCRLEIHDWRCLVKISTVLDHIETGHMALPEFQRGYVWNRDQVRGLFDSLYRRHPVGGLLVWATEAKTADHRGDGPIAAGVVKLLLDGQQRMTSLYGVVRGSPPEFFDGNTQAFTGLRFHLEDEVFGFYQSIKMQDDPLWIDVTKLFMSGQSGHEALIESLAEHPGIGTKAIKFSSRIARLFGILDTELHVEEVTGPEKNARYRCRHF